MHSDLRDLLLRLEDALETIASIKLAYKAALAVAWRHPAWTEMSFHFNDIAARCLDLIAETERAFNAILRVRDVARCEAAFEAVRGLFEAQERVVQALDDWQRLALTDAKSRDVELALLDLQATLRHRDGVLVDLAPLIAEAKAWRTSNAPSVSRPLSPLREN